MNKGYKSMWRLFLFLFLTALFLQFAYSSVTKEPQLWNFIAFEKDRNIWIMGINGENPQQLTTDGTSSSPVFSPDGKKIAFVSDRDGNFEVYIMNANGTGQTKLTKSRYSSCPVFHPDCK